MMQNRQTPVSVGILAGGKSTRMGQNKALLKIGSERIIERQIRQMGSFGEILISAAHKGEYEDFGCRVVCDENKDIGPIEGIRQVLKNSKEEFVFVCASDMPFINSKLVSCMAEFISSDYDCYVMADEDNIQPLCAIYSKSVLPVIEELIGQGKYRLREIFKRVRTKYIILSNTCFDKKVIKNLNAKEDYAEINKPFVFCVSGFSDSGKTGLIVKLINEFIKEDMSVAVIKHDGHGHIKDFPGSDTAQFKEAGAKAAVIFSDNDVLMHAGETMDETQIIKRLGLMKAPPDVVIIEGMKHSDYPRIEVVRKEVKDKSICDPSTIICIVTDCISPENSSCPVYGFDDIRGIFLCLKKVLNME